MLDAILHKLPIQTPQYLIFLGLRLPNKSDPCKKIECTRKALAHIRHIRVRKCDERW